MKQHSALPDAARMMIIAGEASGDQIAAAALREFRLLDPECEVLAVGGSALEAAGATLIQDCSDLAVMGLGDVLARLPRILAARRKLISHLQGGRVRLLVLVDYPGFNLPLACRAHELGLRTLYYISPKYWAWRRGRLQRVADCTDRQALIFPFEEEDYRRVGGNAEFVGHPVFDLVGDDESREAARKRLGLAADRTQVLMLPGSRNGELKRHLPVLRDVSRMLAAEELDLLLQFPSHLKLSDWKSELEGFASTRIIEGHYHELLAAADIGLVASGTASLEAAAHGLPHLVYYKIDGLARHLAERFVQVQWASPVNIAAGTELVPERLNAEARGLVLANWVLARLREGDLARQGDVLKSRVQELLQGGGASRRVAEMIREEWLKAGGGT